MTTTVSVWIETRRVDGLMLCISRSIRLLPERALNPEWKKDGPIVEVIEGGWKMNPKMVKLIYLFVINPHKVCEVVDRAGAISICSNF